MLLIVCTGDELVGHNIFLTEPDSECWLYLLGFKGDVKKPTTTKQSSFIDPQILILVTIRQTFRSGKPKDETSICLPVLTVVFFF